MKTQLLRFLMVQAFGSLQLFARLQVILAYGVIGGWTDKIIRHG
jgi:hypothetical protein